MYIVLLTAKYQHHLVNRNVTFLNQGLSLFLEQEDSGSSRSLIKVQLLKEVFPDFPLDSKSYRVHSLPPYPAFTSLSLEPLSPCDICLFSVIPAH